MIIPKKITIEPHEYKVIYQKSMGDDHGALGQSRHGKNIIALDPDQTESQLLDTFLHEIFHCINNQIHFVETDRKTEEDAVAKLAPMFLQVIKDNPKVFTK